MSVFTTSKMFCGRMIPGLCVLMLVGTARVYQTRVYTGDGRTNDGREVTLNYDYKSKLVKHVSKKFRREIEKELLPQFYVDIIPPGPKTIVKTDNFRIDMQSTFKSDNIKCYNLQIQQNVKRQSGQSTTYAGVIVAVEDTKYLDDHVLRNAFVQSLNEHALAKLTILPKPHSQL